MKKMNRSAKFAFIFSVIISIMFLIIVCSMEKKDKNDKVTTQNQNTLYEKQVVMYTENDEDAAYNYIENPDVLKNTEMPYVACLTLNDKIDKYLRDYNYVSEILTIKNAYQKGTIIYFEVFIGDTDAYINVEYDIRYNEFEFILK